MAPKFYTFKSQLPSGTMPGFKAGKGYYARGKALPAAAATDPFAPVSPQDITSIVNKYQGMLGAPVPTNQIASQAQSEIAPYLSQIEGDTAKQAAAAAAQIKGLTDSYASLLGQTNYAAPYNAAATEQASVDAALKQALDKNGTDLASGLSSRLGALQDPAVAQAAGSLADRGQAIGTTQLASGSAALSNLLANAAAAGEYGVKQPGIARNSGIQALGQSEAQHEHDLTSAVQQAESQLPQIIQAIQSNNQTLRGNQAQLGSSLYQALTGQNITKATAKAGLVNDQTNAALSAAKAAADSAAQQATITERTRHDKQTEAATQKKIAAAKKPKPLTTKDRQAMVSALDLYYYGKQPQRKYVVDPTTKQGSWVPVPGTGVPAVDYPTAVQNFVDSFGLTRQQAEALANQRYKPGEDGRPRSAAQKAKAAAQKKEKAAERKAVTTAIPPLPLDALAGGAGRGG